MCTFKQKTHVLVKYKVLATIPPAPLLASKSLVKESEVAKTSLCLCLIWRCRWKYSDIETPELDPNKCSPLTATALIAL